MENFLSLCASLETIRFISSWKETPFGCNSSLNSLPTLWSESKLEKAHDD